MTNKAEEEELLAMKEAVARVRETQTRIRDSYHSLQEIADILERLMYPQIKR